MAHSLPDDLVRFIQLRLSSLWAVELMLTMMAQSGRDWDVDALVRELRASEPLIKGLLDRFQQAGLVARNDGGTWRWQPASAEIVDLSRRTAEAHAVTPFAVVKVLAEAPGDRLREFADAFRLRKD